MNLNTPIKDLGKIAAQISAKLKQLGVDTVRDLLFYYPFRYEDYSRLLKIKNLLPNVLITIKGKIELLNSRRSWKKHMIVIEAIISDETGSIKAVWFNQRYLTKILQAGDYVYLSGKAVLNEAGLELINPAYEKIGKNSSFTAHTNRIVPIYSTTERLSQKQIRFLMKTALPLATNLPDWLPTLTIKNARLVPLKTAIRQVHFPDNFANLEKARFRLKFDEIFTLQTRALLTKKELHQLMSHKIEFKEKETKNFVVNLPFKLTDPQRKTAWEIIKDLERPRPMNRLLEGDVGSGKTVVSAIAIFNVLLNHFQVAYLAPTEILAHQQFNSFAHTFKQQTFTIALLTGASAKISRQSKQDGRDHSPNEVKKTEVIKKLKNGEIDLVIGTHALIQEKIFFNKLAFVIVDEQHRFGVHQRHQLLRGSTQIKTQIDADDDFLYKNLTYAIRGAAFEVANGLGLGLKENVYQKAFEESLKQKKLSYEREKTINVTFHDTRVGSFKPDFVIDNKVIVELKALPFMGKIEEQQLWTYLKASSHKVALLINFGSEKLNIRRIIYDTARDNIRSSASSDLHVSASHLRPSALMPHLLSMTATPIPRSLALTLYGDLDLSIIDELPRNRKPIITKVVSPQDREQAYNFLRQEIKKERQIFVICPLIDPSDKLGVKAATEEFDKLNKKIFTDLAVALLHGRLTTQEKQKIMGDFLQNRINVLVSTSVIEVGIDIPNATVVVIESAERFGLAQLHQLRGRVGRSEHQSYCLLFTESESEMTVKRMQAFVTAKNGFELAERDLEFRGPGEVYGVKQSGFFDSLKIAKLTDFLVIKAAKAEVEKLMAEDPTLENHPLIKEKVRDFDLNVHLE